jgi:simple sugar transport system permease protein
MTKTEPKNLNSIGYASFIRRIPLTSIIIGGFWVLVLIVGRVLGLPIGTEISNILQRVGMWGLLVLSMVPSIQSGTGPNFALPVGICGGLLAMTIAMAAGFTGGLLLLVAGCMAVVFGALLGFVYGKLMNMVKGSEMAIATYTGFSVTMLFCIVWLIIPIRHPNMGMFIGETGLRQTIALRPFDADFVLDSFLQFTIPIVNITVPTGSLLLLSICCVLLWLFFRTKTGISISAVGMNPVFAKATGLNVDKSRLIANMITTSLAAVGIIIYAQSFGFLQLYDAPLWMAFTAVAAIFVGGASVQRSKIIHVAIGSFLFLGLLTTAPPTFGRLIPGVDLTEALRMIVQNGVILYALTQLGKGGGK